MKSGVYRITNINNNKSYIGSSVDIKKRINSHFNSLRRKNHANSHLQRSFNKYGEDRFTTEILISCPINELISLEQYLMDYYQPEYNIAKIAGSTLGVKPSLESRQKGAEARRIYYQNNKVSEETKKKQRLASKGRKLSSESIRKANETKKNKSQEERDKDHQSKFKPVYQIDPISLKIINEYRCIRDGAKAININQTYISGVLLGYQYTAGGFIWCLVKDYTKEKIEEIFNKINKLNYNCRAITQYDLDMNFVQTFNSIKEASDYLNIKYSNIADVIRRNKSGKTNGFIWKLTEG